MLRRAEEDGVDLGLLQRKLHLIIGRIVLPAALAAVGPHVQHTVTVVGGGRLPVRITGVVPRFMEIVVRDHHHDAAGIVAESNLLNTFRDHEQPGELRLGVVRAAAGIERIVHVLEGRSVSCQRQIRLVPVTIRVAVSEVVSAFDIGRGLPRKVHRGSGEDFTASLVDTTSGDSAPRDGEIDVGGDLWKHPS